MTDINTHRNEHLGDLPDNLRGNPYVVPDGYFVDLARRTTFRAQMRQTMEESAAVPEGYFDQLHSTILARTRLEAITSSATDTGLSVPAGYFDGLAEKTLARVRDSQTAVSEAETPVRRIGAGRWLRYVAASVTLLAAATAVYFGIGTESQEAAVANNLETVPAQEIISYLELYAESDYLLYQSTADVGMDDWLNQDFSEADIEAYFNNTL